MSDTPRTDAAIFIDDYKSSPGYVPADFARQLERELALKCGELEDKQLCREGLWYCSTGERLARENRELREALEESLPYINKYGAHDLLLKATAALKADKGKA
jgi:hypothetical protein